MKSDKKPKKEKIVRNDRVTFFTLSEIPDVIADSGRSYYCSGDHIGISHSGGKKHTSGSDEKLSA